MPYGWEGNRRSGIAQAMSGYPSTDTNGPLKDMSIPPTLHKELGHCGCTKDSRILNVAP